MMEDQISRAVNALHENPPQFDFIVWVGTEEEFAELKDLKNCPGQYVWEDDAHWPGP